MLLIRARKVFLESYLARGVLKNPCYLRFITNDYLTNVNVNGSLFLLNYLRH